MHANTSPVSTTAASTVDLVCFSPRPAAEVTLVCLPYAGGGASVYRQLSALLGDDVEVRSARLPGRESRIAEDPVVSALAVADAVQHEMRGPYAFYGHSMGARLAYEATRVLRERGARGPVAVVVGGCKAPHLTSRGPLEGISALPDDALVDRLTAAGGMPAEVLATPELLELVLPALRADLAWCDAYRHRSGPPLDVPLHAVAGADDPTLSTADMVAWGRHTHAPFALDVLAGDHFFLHESAAALAGLIRTRLLGQRPDRAEGAVR